MLAFLALTTEARPGHRFQTSLRDRLLADHTYSVCPLSDPSECLFDCSQETTIRLVQADLKLRFRIGIGLINHISLQVPGGWHPGLSLAQGRRQLTVLLQQQSIVSL